MSRHHAPSLRTLSNMWTWGLQRTLQGSRISFTIISAIRGPQVLTYRIRLWRSEDLGKALKLGEQIAYNMAVSSVRVARNGGLIDVEVALPERFKKTLHVATLPARKGAWVGLGRTPAGAAVYANFAGTRTCHALISGMTGSGKTVAAHLIAWTLARNNADHRNLRLILIDAKGGVRWRGFEREAHLAHPVIDNAPEAVAALSWALAEMDKRKQARQSEPAIFIIIDEIKELCDLAGKAVAEAVSRIAALGRELGIHLIMATQHPNVDAVGGAIAKANLPLRLTGAVVSSRDAYVCTGVRDSGAEKLQGRGDFLITVGPDTHRVQMAHIRPVDLHKLPKASERSRLDLEQYELDRVLDVTDALDPEHVAVALVEDRGIRWLKEALHIGQDRATIVRRFTTRLKDALQRQGYGVYPVPEHMSPAPVET